MKFGTQLKTHRASHWRFHYVDYDGLKSHLKAHTSDQEFTDQDEAEFVKLLSAELEKVASFQAMKLGEVQRRTEHCEYTIQQHQIPSGKSSEKLTLASFVETESEINKITQDLQDLARFQRLNYTAFLKIIKKHDKHTGFALRAHFMNQLLNNQPFHKESFAILVSRLSCLYNIVRTGTSTKVTKAQSIDSEEDEELEHPGCIPKKAAFWVHPDCVMDLKMLILKYLPLVVYEPTPALNSSHKSTSQLGSYLASESPISTIYLDNHDFDMYMGQLEHREQSETVRLRWYDSERKHVWVEHQQRSMQPSSISTPLLSASGSNRASSLTSVPSPQVVSCQSDPVVTKHRFQIKSKHVPKLVQGAVKMDKVVKQMRRSGQKSEQEIQQFEESTRIVQSRIKKRGLQPVVQTFLNRTAFQVPGDARVRITIDTNVTMVREHRIETSDLYERPWDPTYDLQADKHPFSGIRDQDIVRFPYAIMQIRTLTGPEEEIPSWVDHIAQSHLVEMVPNFAKDLHAVANLYESSVGLLPFWLSDMHRDIRKPAMLTGGFTRCSTMRDSGSNSDSNAGSSAGSNDTLTSSQSIMAATFSDSSSPSSQSSLTQSSSTSKKALRSHRGTSKEFYTPNVTFDEEVQDLVAVNRKMLERQGSSSTIPKVKKSVVSCLKKSASDNGMNTSGSNSGSSTLSRSSSNEDLSSIRGGGGGYGSTLSTGKRSSKRVPVKKSTARKWADYLRGWVPFLPSRDDADHFDAEAQYSYSFVSHHDRVKRQASGTNNITRMFWSGLPGLNIALLFVGLVLALMNLGDGVGLEAASLLLVVSCLCMGTTVWAHLIRMDGHEASLSSEEAGVESYSSKRSVNERSRLQHHHQVHSSQYTHARHRGQWARTRLMPLITFVCLVAVVGLNAAARMHPLSEDVGSD
ncbi:vacuolar transporter chaperone [Dissophora globulifera]|uniref:Vacuolar transporter chaperone n=1 Tax=Dissophora globulifera TaxID=979702 RepID=A0A9P6UZQ1_9FUNG|nr:vacuolar transporter chaperone [Dissophora globulifera]